MKSKLNTKYQSKYKYNTNQISNKIWINANLNQNKMEIQLNTYTQKYNQDELNADKYINKITKMRINHW